MKPVETITIEEYRRLTARTKRGRSTRPDLPAAAPSERTGLGPLLAAGWNIEWDAAMRCRLYKAGKDTGWGEEKAICLKAKELGNA